ncbi:hypothetical protein ASE59_11515 [Sphingomonas sp. Leaf10]|nr:hypothetical protein ASE59_11515 [Sphingomonas sp. Leaf10]
MRAGWHHVFPPEHLVHALGRNSADVVGLRFCYLVTLAFDLLGSGVEMLAHDQERIERLDVCLAVGAPYPALLLIVSHLPMAA